MTEIPDMLCQGDESFFYPRHGRCSLGFDEPHDLAEEVPDFLPSDPRRDLIAATED